jgi:hypothetical protein
MKKTPEIESYKQYRNSTLYMILTCGIILTMIGVYLYVSNRVPHGTTLPTRHVAGGKDIYITGITTMVLGVAISIFPIYQLIRKLSKK